MRENIGELIDSAKLTADDIEEMRRDLLTYIVEICELGGIRYAIGTGAITLFYKDDDWNAPNTTEGAIAAVRKIAELMTV